MKNQLKLWNTIACLITLVAAMFVAGCYSSPSQAKAPPAASLGK